MGREEHCKQISLACVGSARSVSGTLGLPLFTACVLSQSTLFRLRLLAGELSEVGLGLHALPRSKLLRCSFSVTPQRRRLGWACVLCPSQVRAAQATRCLASTLSPGGRRVLSPPWSQPLGFLGGSARTRLSCTMCLSPLESWSLAATLPADVNRLESQEVLVSNWEPAHSLVEDAISGAEIAPFWLWLPPICLHASGGWGGWASPQPASSPLVFT